MPKAIRINEVGFTNRLKFSIFSANGDLILEKSRPFTESRLEAFIEFDILDVYAPETDEDDDDCKASLKFTEKDILDVKDDDVLGLAVCGPKGRLLVQAGKTLSPQQREMLLRQGAVKAHLRRPLDKDLELRTANLGSKLRKITRAEATTGISTEITKSKVATSRIIKNTTKLDTDSIDQLAAQEESRNIELDHAVRKLVEPIRLTDPALPEDLERVRESRRRLFAAAKKIFDTIEKGGNVDGTQIDAFARDVITTLVADRYHRLHLAGADESEDYLVSHSLTTLVLSVNIAARLEYAVNEILELCYGALLHDIGMLKISVKTRNKPGALSDAERREVNTHPVLGLEICQRIKGLPVSAPLVIVQENERLDGSGYPRGRKGERLHPFAKIVAVATSFDAMTRKRNFREAKHPYHAMKEILGEVNAGRVNADSAKALLETLSLFPIGSGVRLSDARTGYVLDAAGKEYTRPVVVIGDISDDTTKIQPEIIDLQEPKHKTTKIIDIFRKEDEYRARAEAALSI